MSQGDWKISGLGLTIPLSAPGGGTTKWEFPTFDGRVSPFTQRSFDYMGTLACAIHPLPYSPPRST